MARKQAEGPNQDEALERLYAVDPEDFVAERKVLERELRDRGEAEAAAEVAGRRKPTLPVFAANKLARARAADVGKLIDAAQRIAAAHQSGERERLREAQVDLANRVRELLRHAEQAAGRPLSEAAEQRLALLLRAAAVDPEAAERLRRGVLSEELEPTGFEGLAGLSLAPAAKRSGSGREADARSRRQAELREKVAEVERDLADARGALRDAEKELTGAERQAERARRRVAELEERLERARDAL